MTRARHEAEQTIAVAIGACEAGATPAQLSDLADAIDALRDGVIGAALTLARASMTSRPKTTNGLRPDHRRQTLDEIRDAFADYRQQRQTRD
jgi:hypothetical protein